VRRGWATPPTHNTLFVTSSGVLCSLANSPASARRRKPRTAAILRRTRTFRRGASIAGVARPDARLAGRGPARRLQWPAPLGSERISRAAVRLKHSCWAAWDRLSLRRLIGSTLECADFRIHSLVGGDKNTSGREWSRLSVHRPRTELAYEHSARAVSAHLNAWMLECLGPRIQLQVERDEGITGLGWSRLGGHRRRPGVVHEQTCRVGRAHSST